jgi:hypothetical protein
MYSSFHLPDLPKHRLFPPWIALFFCGRNSSISQLLVDCLGAVVSHQSQPGFVDESGGLQRLARLLVRQLGGSEFAEFIVDEGKQLFRRARITILNL